MEVMPDAAGRSPRDLARAALEQADSAQINVQGMKAITTAIVALAGEVHALTERVLATRTELKVERMVVGEIDV